MVQALCNKPGSQVNVVLNKVDLLFDMNVDVDVFVSQMRARRSALSLYDMAMQSSSCVRKCFFETWVSTKLVMPGPQMQTDHSHRPLCQKRDGVSQSAQADAIFVLFSDLARLQKLANFKAKEITWL